jgi:integrase
VEYVAQYDAPRGEDGKRRRKAVVGNTYAEVVAKLKALAREADTGRVAEPGKLTVADLVDRFLAARGRRVEATTLAMYRHTLFKHVKPRLGGVRLAHLTALHVEAFLESMEVDGVGPRARRASFDLLSSVLSYGVKLDVVAGNAAARCDRPKAQRPKVSALSAEQAMQLLKVARETAPPKVWAAVALALVGLRRGEVFGLTWGDVAFEPGEVRVRQALKRPAKGSAYVSTPKTQAGRRAVPLPSWALAALRAHRAGLGAVPMPTVPVFTNDSGGWVHFSHWMEQHWIPLRDAAGLPQSATFHGLRHTAATLLLGSGVDVRTTQGIIGHSRGSTTLDVYADFIPNNAERAMAGLDVLLAEKVTEKVETTA